MVVDNKNKNSIWSREVKQLYIRFLVHENHDTKIVSMPFLILLQFFPENADRFGTVRINRIIREPGPESFRCLLLRGDDNYRRWFVSRLPRWMEIDAGSKKMGKEWAASVVSICTARQRVCIHTGRILWIKDFVRGVAVNRWRCNNSPHPVQPTERFRPQQHTRTWCTWAFVCVLFFVIPPASTAASSRRISFTPLIR
jgi:hypothetical protein